MTRATAIPDREQVAGRLLNGSVRRSYDPVVDLDWDAPLDEGKFFLPPELISLYGTAMWDEMTPEQRIELSRQEMANVLSVGIWFENLLNRVLLRTLITGDPTSRHYQYALTEMGDECRHMTMFGRTIDKAGAAAYRLDGKGVFMFGALLPAVMRGSMLWISTLIGEEIFDAWQREMMNDPQLQPVVARMMQVHVTEEARHIRWAREGVRRRVAHARRWDRHFGALLNGVGGPLLAYAFTNPLMYRRAGLDVRRARREARANPHHLAAKQRGFASLGRFLEENEMMHAPARRMWRRAGFLA
jgi:hypothetical protein